MAKKSRRARREETQKQTKATIAPPAETVAESVDLPVITPVVTPKAAAMPENQRKTLDFAREYFHVYYDVRNVLMIGGLMFLVLVALSFAI